MCPALLVLLIADGYGHGNVGISVRWDVTEFIAMGGFCFSCGLHLLIHKI